MLMVPTLSNFRTKYQVPGGYATGKLVLRGEQCRTFRLRRGEAPAWTAGKGVQGTRKRMRERNHRTQDYGARAGRYYLNQPAIISVECTE